jgi:hypothetical protein
VLWEKRNLLTLSLPLFLLGRTEARAVLKPVEAKYMKLESKV